MNAVFKGEAVRLARVFHGYSLDDVAERVEKTKQYLHKIEVGQSVPTEELKQRLADVLSVEMEFFSLNGAELVSEDQMHFRKLLTTRSTVKLVAIARAEVFRRLAEYLDDVLDLPPVRFPTIESYRNAEDIERIAESCRIEWGLGEGPIANMTRLAENLGALVTTFSDISAQIDALSVPLKRPFIVRNDAKESVCRMRFDLGHECGHFILHEGRITGDRLTETDANRFSSALLLPRSIMAKLFPRPKYQRLDWKGISEFKLTWKVSKAAILYRAHQLGIVTDDQYRSGVITLKRSGQAIRENEDHLVPPEPPELIGQALKTLRDKLGVTSFDVAQALKVKPAFLANFLPNEFARDTPEILCGDNVISFPGSYRR
jgi:Zn-dependent peptidase ImmA (M78 family)/DNA-binding XRE family transcriptional regulator